MPDHIQIVKLTPEEWQPYRQLRLEALSSEPQAFSTRYADMLQKPDAFWQDRLRAAQAGEKSWLLFAKENDRLVGIIGAYREENSPAVDIISVYVTPEKRGQGIASALMAAILAEVGQAGALRKAVLTVTVGQKAAIALYRHFGFQFAGEMTSVMGDGESHTGYIMEKPLIPSG